MAAEISRGLGRHGWSKWRSSTNMLVTFDGNGEVQISSGRRRFVSGGLGSGLGEGLRAGQPPCGCGLGRRISASQRRFCTRGECSSKDVWRSRSRPSWPSCQGPSGVVCFCVLFLQDTLSEVTKFYPFLKLRVFVDDIMALLLEKNR